MFSCVLISLAALVMVETECAIVTARSVCPHLPCPPPPPCDDPIKTYFYLPDGTKCRGCDQCPPKPTPQPCPTVSTHAWPRDCQHVEIYTYQFSDQTCYGDPYCADNV